MFVYGGSSTGTTVTAVAERRVISNAGQPRHAALAVFGTNLANSTATNTGNPLPYSLAGVSATVNGLAAPVIFASSGMLNIQVPYAAGAGPAVIGVNNNGQVSWIRISNLALPPPESSPTRTETSCRFQSVNGRHRVGTLRHRRRRHEPSDQNRLLAQHGNHAARYPLLPLLSVNRRQEFPRSSNSSASRRASSGSGLQVNILVPSTTPLGNQPVVVTVGGAASAPVNVVVQPPN